MNRLSRSFTAVTTRRPTWRRWSAAPRVISAFIAISHAGESQPAEITQQTVLTGAAIVDTRTGRTDNDMVLVIEGGKITQISRMANAKTRTSARFIDAHGKYVVPGYLDMHTHALNDNDPNQLRLMIAKGITGFRQMSGSPAMLSERREGKWLHTAMVPELLALPGDVLAGPNSATPELAVAEVRRQKEMGTDFIKIIDLPPAAFFAALDEATHLGLPTVGHLPNNVDVWEASQHGMRSIEHLGPNENLLLGCSSEEKELRQVLLEKPRRELPITAEATDDAMIQLVIANPVLFLDPVDFTVMQRIIDSYSDAKCRTLAAAFVAHDTWQVPTLIRIRTMEIGDDPAYTKDPNLRYVAPATRQLWQQLGQQFSVKLSNVQRKTLRDFFALQLKLVKLFQDTGVKMLAGSDAGAEGEWDISGFALHQEFDLLREAGLSPLDILQMTTLNAARFLGRESTMGSVEVGKDANLVLLDANPITSTQNLHKIHAVVRAGAFESGEVLNGLLKAVATSDFGPAPAAAGMR